ncbi:PA3496 family putative envelope integrity protein [uncultured Lamprocystis sp.]|jgi:hypothetical protein|uniref:PA3496 family putative envelope integrity protein n=1 Tax=uncultured Lamprocystis sp. TaxID=543132 RepID=UPI0025DAF6E3|nr:hypothetical protein [uncultured Lamprocystis sp.]
MLETEGSFGEETAEVVPPMNAADDVRGSAPNLAIRRRLERMRELKRLRELLDDPDFDDLN